MLELQEATATGSAARWPRTPGARNLEAPTVARSRASSTWATSRCSWTVNASPPGRWTPTHSNRPGAPTRARRHQLGRNRGMAGTRLLADAQLRQPVSQGSGGLRYPDRWSTPPNRWPVRSTTPPPSVRPDRPVEAFEDASCRSGGRRAAPSGRPMPRWHGRSGRCREPLGERDRRTASGSIVVTGARFVADDDRELHILEHGETARLDINYAISNPDIARAGSGRPRAAQGRNVDVCRYITRNLVFDARERARRGR